MLQNSRIQLPAIAHCAIFVAELVLAVAVLRHSLSFVIALTVHILLTALLLVATCVSRDDRPISALFALACLTACLGPIGPVMAAAIAWGDQILPARPSVSQDWFARIQVLEARHKGKDLTAQLAAGRARAFQGGSLESFVSIMESGSIEKKEAVLAVLSRHYHADYRPVLDLGLRNSEPSVRVQSAAALVNLRERKHAQLAAALERLESASPATTEMEVLRAAQSAADALDCGVIDEQGTQKGRARLLAALAHQLDGAPGGGDETAADLRVLRLNQLVAASDINGAVREIERGGGADLAADAKSRLARAFMALGKHAQAFEIMEGLSTQRRGRVSVSGGKEPATYGT